MKLIIDIPETFYQNEKENKGYVSDLKRDIVWDAMIKGTPLDVLDKIRAEISDFEEEVFNRPNTDYSDYAAVRHCLEIIDKYKVERSE